MLRDTLDGAFDFSNFLIDVHGFVPIPFLVNSGWVIDNQQRNADLSSRKDLIKNADESVDLYFGPEAPAGKEKNWVQTGVKTQIENLLLCEFYPS